MSTKRTCYIAGRMRGFPNYNFPLFNRCQRILSASWNVISPAEEDIKAGEPWTDPARPDWADVKYALTDAQVRRLIRRDVGFILSLRRQKGDAIIMLPTDWRRGVGAGAEINVGRWARIPAYQMEFVGENGFSLTGLEFDVHCQQWVLAKHTPDDYLNKAFA